MGRATDFAHRVGCRSVFERVDAMRTDARALGVRSFRYQVQVGGLADRARGIPGAEPECAVCAPMKRRFANSLVRQTNVTPSSLPTGAAGRLTE